MDAYQHLQLLKRHERLRTLRSVIFDSVKPGSKVLDAGSGSGILSIWAAQAGASEVLGIDREAVPLAQALAAENGVHDRVRFIHGDLEKLRPTDVGQFDVILGLLYLNDPRRDAAQAELVASLRERFLAPSGTLIPDNINYTGVLVDWPSQDHGARHESIKSDIAAIEANSHLGMNALRGAVASDAFVPWFPPKTNGRYSENDYRQLSDPLALQRVDYSQPLSPFPDAIQMEVTESGLATAVIWTQQLLAGNTVLFVNESLSWLEHPQRVDPGTKLRTGLGPEWTQRNVLSLT